MNAIRDVSGFVRFRKHESNPILTPTGDGWESRAVFNPAAWTDGSKVYLLYRAEGPAHFPARAYCSRIGLAVSDDGVTFRSEPRAVLEPTESYELPGGCEDPRVVRIGEHFHMTYTAYDGKVARLAMALSRDLRSWEKIGPLLPDEHWHRFFPRNEHRRLFPTGWSKSGAIFAERIAGYYWMFFGDTHIWAARSTDLRRWDVVPDPVLSPRSGFFDSRLVEPGPPPMLLPDGIWLGYNSADDSLRYAFGQAVLSVDDPTNVLHRSRSPLLEPTLSDEIEGQVPCVVFATGLVHFRGQWLLYYGMADSRIGVAKGELI